LSSQCRFWFWLVFLNRAILRLLYRGWLFDNGLWRWRRGSRFRLLFGPRRARRPWRSSRFISLDEITWEDALFLRSRVVDILAVIPVGILLGSDGDDLVYVEIEVIVVL
jgi:hypothetical protein